ncbi:unnamed protein product [Absidia cylindrospora]
MIVFIAVDQDLLLIPKPLPILSITISKCIVSKKAKHLQLEQLVLFSKNYVIKTRTGLWQVSFSRMDEKDGPSVYNVPLGGSLHRQPFAIGGSGSTYIYGYCDSVWKDDMTQEEAVTFVKNALSLAMARDGSSGGVIRLAVITKDGVDRQFVPGNELPTHWEG